MTSPLAYPVRLPCGVKIPNRICKSAMTEGLADSFDRPTPELNTLYRTWSVGGTGLLISGNIMIDRRYLERAGNMVLEDDSALEQFKALAKAGTAEGNQFWLQLSHPGRQCATIVNTEPLSPSNVKLNFLGLFSKPKAMSQLEIADVVQRFVSSARLAKEAGFTGVQIHGAHGYLISQFLSPKTNHRQDQWGGSLENRARFVRTIIKAVRQAVGPDYPVGIKLNSADFQKGGFTLEECVQVVAWLREDSVDLLEISGGNYEQMSLLGIDAKDVRDSTRKREAYFLEYAKAIKDAAKIPLIITGGFRSRDVMEQAVASGEIDVIGLARPLCTNPNVSSRLIKQEIDRVDDFEHQLVLGSGFWGNNSKLGLIKAINSVGQVSYYYQQIIRLAKGQDTQQPSSVFPLFIKHVLNDTKLNLRRNKAQNKAFFSND